MSAPTEGESHQRALLLHELKTPYRLAERIPRPTLRTEDEVLVRTLAIGLNPIDWKAPDFGFGIPVLPYISGRELVGEVVAQSQNDERLQLDDKVIVISTDYRDTRKAAYQEYVVAHRWNVIRLPPQISIEQGSILGVAAATSVIALGVCLGLDFSDVADGPDLFNLVRQVERFRIADDIAEETLSSLSQSERAVKGDWVAIWGGSSTCAFVANQLARLAGLRTIIVLDTRKHGAALTSTPGFTADFVVDNQDEDRAVEIIRSVTNDELRFAIDVVGRTTATHLQQALQHGQNAKASDEKYRPVDEQPTPPSSPPNGPVGRRSHLVGLTGVPKNSPHNIVPHSVPVKLFHEVHEAGQQIVLWLERLLSRQLLFPPRVLDVVNGLEEVNAGLDRLRRGEISGGRLVANVR